MAALFNLHRENLWSDPFSGHHLAGASGLRLKHDILMDRPLHGSFPIAGTAPEILFPADTREPRQTVWERSRAVDRTRHPGGASLHPPIKKIGLRGSDGLQPCQSEGATLLAGANRARRKHDILTNHPMLSL